MRILQYICLLSSLIWVAVEMNASEQGHLIHKLESVSQADTKIYQLKTHQGKRMDCLKVFQAPGIDFHGVFFGVYHRLEGGVFGVYIARSTDLRSWQEVTLLDEHASQPTIFPCQDGSFLLAYEKDAPNSCWIGLRSYDQLDHLLKGKYAKEHHISRSLAPTAEGTPSFESVKIGPKGLDDSEIRLRFHYFKDVRVDQLAVGTLANFNSWHAEVSEEINHTFTRNGWAGNLGDRDRFIWRDQVYYLQESQRKRGDWSSWRIQLCDFQGMPIHTLNFKTDGHSKSFANPNATWVFDDQHLRKLVVTLFLPSEGNPSSEAGTLLYVVPGDAESFQKP